MRQMMKVVTAMTMRAKMKKLMSKWKKRKKDYETTASKKNKGMLWIT